MKKTGLICYLLALLMLIGCFSPIVFATEAPEEVEENVSVRYGCHTIDAQVPLLGTEKRIENATAVVLYETSSDTLMYAWNADERVYPASLVKIMTALVALRSGKLDNIVAVDADVLASLPKGAVSIGLQEDELMRLEDLLYCMMVASANDAAAVVADHVFGSQNAFVQEMNRYAAEIGCTGTQFTNVHGLHNDEQYTTARDMARILSVALKNESFAKLFSTVHYTVPATNKADERSFSSGNYTMNKDQVQIYYDSRITGGRTGVATDNTRCLAASAEKNGLQYVSIVMGSKSDYAEDGYTVKNFGSYRETSALLDLGFNGYKPVQILYEGQALKQHPIANGNCEAVLGSKKALWTVVPDNVTLSDLTFRYADVTGEFKAPVQKGEHISNVQIWYGNVCLAQTELYAMNKVALQNAGEQNGNGKTSPWIIVLYIVLSLIVLALLVLLGFRIYNKLRITAAKGRKNRYRRYRRRSR